MIDARRRPVRIASRVNPHDPEKLAYVARLGLEIGANAVKFQFALGDKQEENVKDLGWIIQNAGKCKVFISRGQKKSDLDISKVMY